MKKIKVVIISYHPTPYRGPLFDRVAKHPTIDLTVYYCSGQSLGRGWGKLTPSHNHEILQHRFGIWQNLASLKPDVIVTEGYAENTMQLSILYAWLKKIPYIIFSETHLHKKRARLKTYLKPFLLRPIMKRAAAYLPTGTMAKEYLTHYGGNEKMMFFFPNMSDIDFFEAESRKYKKKREEIKRAMGIQTRYVIIYVGRLIQLKNCHYLIAAFEKLRKKRDDVSLVLVGDGDFRSQLEKQVAEAHIPDVYLLGNQDHTELPKLYAIADLSVLLSDSETWGAVVSEAMASGLPVIVTRNVGCAPDIVFERENGFIIPERDVESLLTPLEYLLGNAERVVQMGQKSKEIIRRWDGQFAESNFIKAVTAAEAQRRLKQ